MLYQSKFVDKVGTRTTRGQNNRENNCVYRESHALFLLEHDFGGLDNGCHYVTDFEIHLFCASASDHAFNEIVSNLNDNVSHYSTELKFRYFTRQRIACG